MSIFGYGEDSLTLWALKHRLENILLHLKDDSDPKNTLALFRPSFGRQGKGRAIVTGIADSSQFGEFDAIIGSARRIYLVEAKWTQSRDINRGTVQLREEQVFRHNVFRAYLTMWREYQPNADWRGFSSRCGRFLTVTDMRFPIAPPDSQLARNLESILSRLGNMGTEVTDVLLYLRLKDGGCVNSVQPDSFRLVTIDCPSTDGFIDMDIV